ncbi:Magnesium transport protein CorA [compost metagenome]
MRVFTAITTIFMPLTFITGIYGMNFDIIPGLHYRFGAYVLLGIMAILGFSMFVIFRKKEWL